MFEHRYIMAEEAEKRIVALFRKERGDAAEIFDTAIDACQSIILDMYDNSSENVVSVVRCKDCKYRPIDTGTHQYGHELEFPNEYKCPCQCGDNWYSWMPDDEWFCANGERRADEQT